MKPTGQPIWAGQFLYPSKELVSEKPTSIECTLLSLRPVPTADCILQASQGRRALLGWSIYVRRDESLRTLC